MKIKIGDLVKVCDVAGMVRVESVRGRDCTGRRDFADGSKGERVYKFDVKDVSYDCGAVEAKDDGKTVVPLSRQSERFGIRLAAKHERMAKRAAYRAEQAKLADEALEREQDIAWERERELRIEDCVNGVTPEYDTEAMV